MKKLLIIISALILFSCNNNKKKPTTPTTSDTTWLRDSAKELPVMAVARKKHPVPGTGGGGGTTVPPTSTSAKNIILLVFNGGQVSNTSWNLNGPIVFTPCGLADSVIEAIRIRVRQAFDTLNVDFTEDEAVYNATATNHRQKIIFTTTHDWFGNGAAGVSFIGSFGSEQPCWVFTDLMHFSIKTKEAACHELGHTLGLFHQVLPSDPNCYTLRDLVIMGYTYNTSTNSWSVGQNANCVIQNDLQTMASMVGWKQ